MVVERTYVRAVNYCNGDIRTIHKKIDMQEQEVYFVSLKGQGGCATLQCIISGRVYFS